MESVRYSPVNKAENTKSSPGSRPITAQTLDAPTPEWGAKKEKENFCCLNHSDYGNCSSILK